MLHSMTGFARESAEFDIGTLSWEIRAVNHRYLDVQFRLPDDLRAKEQAFRQQASSTLGRGKVECSLHFRPANDAGDAMPLDEALIRLLAKRSQEVESLMPGTRKLSTADVLRWPGVVQQTEVDVDALLKEAAPLLDKTLQSLNSMRQSEGARVADLLTARCDDIATIATSVRARMPEVLAAVRRKQRERIDKLDIEADPARLEIELAMIAQKIDVDEEIDRLDSHLVEIADALKDKKPVGRRLDFLMQELNREANTLGSKSADTETTKAAVDLKVLIEQMREQIQNVE